ncbi:hypothetical protein LguiB_007786 [Lonicera macranthoides]
MYPTPLPSLSSSFNSHSSGKLQEIAAKVVEEFRQQSKISGEFHFQVSSDRVREHTLHVEEEELDNKDDNDDDDSDFEFSFVCKEPNSSPISADEIFHNGQIRPTFPIFNRHVLAESNRSNSSSNDHLQLSELFVQDRNSQSYYSSEADDLDRVQPETYCVWAPKAEESQGRCKKSNSTGASSKRSWKFRDLLPRSNSDGKQSFAFLTHSNAKSKDKVIGNVEKATAKGASDGVSTTEAHYVKKNKRGMKESERLRSYLPYREDLVGLFVNMNGFGRNMRPF